MSAALHFIVLAYHDDCVDWLSHELRRAGWQPAPVRLSTLGELESLLERRPCFLAWEADGPDDRASVVRAVRRQAPDLPLLVLCSPDDEQAGIDAMDAGADDYLLTTQLGRLAPLVRRWLGNVFAEGAYVLSRKNDRTGGRKRTGGVRWVS